MNKRLPFSLGEFLKLWLPVSLTVAVGFFVAYRYVGAAPPKTIRIATGEKDGAYYAFAQQYARLLASDGIVLEIVPTAGSVQNLALLRTGAVSLAFVQGGTAAPQDKEILQSLGSLFLEPIWIFTSKPAPVGRLAELKGKRVAIGAEGSGTYLLATQLLDANGVTDATATRLRQNLPETVLLLAHGQVDAAFFVASPAAPTIRKLLETGTSRKSA